MIGAVKPQTFIEILLGISYESFPRWYTATMHAGRKMYVIALKALDLTFVNVLLSKLMNLADRFGTTDPSRDRY
jgi:hypothetical protein